VRVPLIVKWPGVTKAGSACDEPVISTDFYPTLLEAAGLPPRPAQHLDGVSLVPLLKGEKQSLGRDAIYWHYPHTSNQGGGPYGAVRAGDWKLIEWYESGRVELYNLNDDLREKNDLAEEMPERARALREKLKAWRQSVHAEVPKLNPDFPPRAAERKE
jgi:arylsulfatase A-like enzyme